MILQFLTLRTSLTCASVYVAFLVPDEGSPSEDEGAPGPRECVVEAEGCDSAPLAFEVEAEASEEDSASALMRASSLTASGVE